MLAKEDELEVFFVDDSSQKGVRGGMGQVLGLGGLLVAEKHLRPLAAAVDAVAKEAGIPDGEELKWSPKRGSWIFDNLKGEARESCYRAALQAAAQCEAKAIVICWDTGRTTLKGSRAFEKCVDYAFERLTVHLAKREAHAIIVADRPGGGKDEEEAFLSAFVERYQNGTEHVDAEQVLMNVLTTSSHHVRHLQLADLVTGITTAMVSGLDRYAGALFPFVQALMIRNGAGTVGGTGLKVFPTGLTNLYHWVLGEDAFYRGGGAMGWRLPTPLMDFATDALVAKAPN